MCLQLITFKNSHYDLPNGSVGRDFVVWLSSQIDLLAQGSIQSERVLLFISIMLPLGPTWRMCVVWFGCALDCEQVWRKRFMLFVSCLICTAMIVEGFCLLMQEMLLIQLIMWLHYGMLQFFGCAVLTSSLILTGDKPNCFSGV